jgi:hypothetical protein
MLAFLCDNDCISCDVLYVIACEADKPCVPAMCGLGLLTTSPHKHALVRRLLFLSFICYQIESVFHLC